MKYQRAASWFTRVAVLFLLICMGLLFTAAAFELKHAPSRNDKDDDGQLLMDHSARLA
jgi:hypothetical protein